MTKLQYTYIIMKCLSFMSFVSSFPKMKPFPYQVLFDRYSFLFKTIIFDLPTLNLASAFIIGEEM